MQLLPLGASLVALDRLERLLRRHPEAKPTEHFSLLGLDEGFACGVAPRSDELPSVPFPLSCLEYADPMSSPC